MTVLFPVDRRPPRPYRHVGNQEMPRIFAPQSSLPRSEEESRAGTSTPSIRWWQPEATAIWPAYQCPSGCSAKFRETWPPTSMTVTPQTESGCRAEQVKTPRGRFAMHQDWDRWTPRAGRDDHAHSRSDINRCQTLKGGAACRKFRESLPPC